MKTHADIKFVIDELNRVRSMILSIFQEYTHLRGLMTEFEHHFLAYVLLPSYQLQQTIQMRQYLEQEYERISSGLEHGLYENSEEIIAEVNHVLRHADFAFVYRGGNSVYDADSTLSSLSAMDTETDLEVDPVKREKLIKEFRKVVLPRVHADTSDAPFEVFNAVYEAYKKPDLLLMMAFLIQYRGEMPPDAEDISSFVEKASEYLEDYRMVLKVLEQRIKKLKADPTSERLQNREQVLLQMKKENRELRIAAQQEAQKLLAARSCLEDLIRMSFSKTEVN